MINHVSKSRCKTKLVFHQKRQLSLRQPLSKMVWHGQIRQQRTEGVPFTSNVAANINYMREDVVSARLELDHFPNVSASTHQSACHPRWWSRMSIDFNHADHSTTDLLVKKEISWRLELTQATWRHQRTWRSCGQFHIISEEEVLAHTAALDAKGIDADNLTSGISLAVTQYSTGNLTTAASNASGQL